MPSRDAEPTAVGSRTAARWVSSRTLSSRNHRGWGKYFQYVLVAALLIRFSYNIVWLHSEHYESPHIPKERMTTVATLTKNNNDISVKNTDNNPDFIQQQNSLLVLDNTIEQSISVRIHDTNSTSTAIKPSPVPKDPEMELKLVQMKSERQSRTRPPTVYVTNTSLSLPTYVPIQWDTTSLAPQAERIENRPWYQDICARAGLVDATNQTNMPRRVLITGILSHPLGTAITLFVSKQCQVKHIMGVEYLYEEETPPRGRATESPFSTDVLENYQRLVHQIATLDIVFLPTLAGRRRQNQRRIHWSRQDGLDRAKVFQATHIIHLEDVHWESEYSVGYGDATRTLPTFSTRWNHARIKWQDMLSIVLDGPANHASPPVLLSVSTTPPLTLPWLSLTSNLLTKALRQVFHSPMSIVTLPPTYGPLVTPKSPNVQNQMFGTAKVQPAVDSSNSSNRSIYVDDAVSTSLRALAALSQTTMTESNPVRHFVVDPSASDLKKTERESRRAKEIDAWLSRLGNNQHINTVNATYLETYGLSTTRFPCASSCGTVHCRPSELDDLRTISHKVTAGCDRVMYMVDLSKDRSTVPIPKNIKRDEVSYPICRVAFVSGQSLLVQNLLKQDSNSNDVLSFEKLQEENGKHEEHSWRLVWLSNVDDKVLSAADLALLRLDPGSLFEDSVKKAMYTNMDEVLTATSSQLEDIMNELDRSAQPASSKFVHVPGTKLLQEQSIRPERARRAVFYAKRRKMCSSDEDCANTSYFGLEQFVQKSNGRLSWNQVSFYTNLATLIDYNREFFPSAHSTNSAPNDSSIPYYWVDPGMYVHDLTMQQSRQFRCAWYSEFLRWNGEGVDSEVLSLAFLVGFGLTQGLYGEPLVDSWIPFQDPSDSTKRIRAGNGIEVFLKIVDG